MGGDLSNIACSAMLFDHVSRLQILDQYRESHGLLLKSAECFEHPKGSAWRIVLARGSDERGFVITPDLIAQGAFPSFFERAITSMCPPPPPRRAQRVPFRPGRHKTRLTL